MFDIELNGISIIALIIGVVEGLKELVGLKGKAITGATLAVAFLLFGLAEANAQGMIPADVMVYVNLVIYALGAALSAGGFYHIVKAAGARIVDSVRYSG